MCESCEARFEPLATVAAKQSGRREGVDRRAFLAAGGALSAGGLVSSVFADDDAANPPAPREKEPARVRAVFLFPPAQVVNDGRMEDSWQQHHWFTWPGNQFEPEKQREKFTAVIRKIADRLGVQVEFGPEAIYQEAKATAWLEETRAAKPDAVLIVNFWNTLSKLTLELAREAAPTAIVYHPVGSNHQLPPAELRKQDGFYYIHSIENWDEIERGLLAVRAKKMLQQSRLLRVGPRADAATVEPLLGVEIATAPADEYNAIFDAIAIDDALKSEAMAFKQRAARVVDVEDAYFFDAIRAHRTVAEMMRRYQADAITITCLLLKHRKPCVSFALNNGNLVPCGCENQLDGTLTQMLGRWLLERAGFMHNPEFDTSENRYFGAHCTCAVKLHGPTGKEQSFWIRPFFHQLPKTPALDVQWTPGEPVLVAKYLTGKNTLVCRTGRVIESPTSPPTGGCATRVLVEMDNLPDVCEMYSGTHPIMFCGNVGDARRFRAFARMYRLTFEGNLA